MRMEVEDKPKMKSKSWKTFEQYLETSLIEIQL